MQKLILVENNNTRELDKLLDDGWEIKDFKPILNFVSTSVSVGGDSYTYRSNTEKGSVYAYVLLIKGSEKKNLYETRN